uniref:Innexin n=1 Tax=Loa loa TaxID=7209 RepID=A0A1I7VN08_LOALO
MHELFVISLTNFMITFVRCVQPQCREILIKFYLQGEGELNEDDCFLLKDKRRLHIYAMEFLGLDGALLLRFIDDHVGVIVTHDITIGLWQHFCRFYGDSNFYTFRGIVTSVKRSEIACSYSSPLSSTAFLSRID